MDYLKVWTSFRQTISMLNDSEKGRLFDAMLMYAETGEEPSEFKGNERFLWIAAKQDIDRTAAKAETLRQNGSKGGIAKSKKKQTIANDSNDKQAIANDSNEKQNVAYKVKKSNIKKDNKYMSDRFEKFYSNYPRKEAKQDAFKAFCSLNPDDELLSRMIEVVEKQKKTEQWTKNGGQYIPLPASWIRGKRWEDEISITTFGSPAGKAVTAQAYEQRDYDNIQDEARKRMLELARAGVGA